MPKSQLFWARSQHPPTQWNLRGGTRSIVEYSSLKKSPFIRTGDRQGFGSGSELDPDSIGSVAPDPGWQDWPTKLKKIKKFHFLRAEGFFCNLDVLYGGLGIGKL
jgi:hypothetical protein